MGATKIHPIIALWRTFGKEMSAAEFRKWYGEQPEEERSQLANLAAEELGRELDEEADKMPDVEPS